MGLAALWNVGSLLFNLPEPSLFVGLLLPLPGILLWISALVAPAALAKATPVCGQTYRLVYDAPPGWTDQTVRIALLNLVKTGSNLEIIWAKDGEGMGCWLAVSEDYEQVLQRLIADVFPAGYIEADQAPDMREGAAILRWKTAEKPKPSDVCSREGIEGVFFRWRGTSTATVALWGPKAMEVAQELAKRADILPGSGNTLRYPKYSGDNPWPGIPTFPPSRANSGLAAVSNLQRLALTLRVNGAGGLIVGRDAENQRVGFNFPDLKGMQMVQVLGHEADKVAITLAHQAVKAGLPVLFLDGHGTATTMLSRRLMREVAANKVLLCDVERPAQSRFRLNPLWLPPLDFWPRLFPGIWLDWLRELGVTPAGLGQKAYRHTLVSTVVTALIAARRNLSLDPTGLRDAMQTPDFLTLLDDDLSGIVGEEMWQWWLTEGRQTSNFDVHLRLGHLRDRLSALLEIPEYRVLWQAPYLNPLAVLNEGGSLLWRLPDPRRRLQPYITSQLLAITTLLSVWPAEQPIIVFLHELNAGSWIKRFRQLPMARLVLASEQMLYPPMVTKQATLLLSRLDKKDAETMSEGLPGVRTADLRRLPPRRLLFQRGEVMGTLDLSE
ncbi:MAG: hypothetical protein BroJett011_59370 [Chloroflexota bacterium]|nr:MAG: hypothetical protein BroJett011_59370 [Chloroflexota bacterium]